MMCFGVMIKPSIKSSSIPLVLMEIISTQLIRALRSQGRILMVLQALKMSL